jgi:hypothetical protein
MGSPEVPDMPHVHIIAPHQPRNSPKSIATCGGTMHCSAHAVFNARRLTAKWQRSYKGTSASHCTKDVYSTSEVPRLLHRACEISDDG